MSTRNSTFSNAIASADVLPTDLVYGWGPFKPKCLQKIMNNAKTFLALLTLINVMQGIIGSLLKVNVTSIERRFYLLSSESGFIISAYDIAGCLSLLPVSYLGGKGHKPRWIAIGIVISSVGTMLLALPHFISPPYTYDSGFSDASSGLANLTSGKICIRRTPSQLNDSAELTDDCLKNAQLQEAKQISLNRMKHVFGTGQFVFGLGSTPLAVLTPAFIDDSVDPVVYPIYIGIYYMGSLIGPALGFIIGGQLLNVFTVIGVVPDDITTESPQWVGAWWIGFVITSVVLLLLSIPVFGFPIHLPSTLTRQLTVTDMKAYSSGDMECKASTAAESSQEKQEECKQPKLDEQNECGVDKEQCIPVQTMPSTTPMPHSDYKLDTVDKLEMEVVPPYTENDKPREQSEPLQIENGLDREQTIPLQPVSPTAPVPTSGRPTTMTQRHTLHHQHKHGKLHLIRGFFVEMWEVLSNKAFVFLSLSAAVIGTLVSGFSTFGPKFVESQFSTSASDAANLFGYTVIPAGALGTLAGGLAMSCLKLGYKAALRMCLGVSVLGLFTQFALSLYCDDLQIAGVTVPYHNSTFREDLTSPCNQACGCPSHAFDPVCGTDEKTYYSPCFAACRSLQTGNNKIYTDCSCIPGRTSEKSDDDWMAALSGSAVFSSATSGKCPSSCYWHDVLLASLFFVIFTTFMCAVPGADLSLRCFPHRLRSLCIGVQWVLIRTLGNIPGPIIFGSVIDSTCLVWHRQEKCSKSLGSCVMYKNKELSFSFLILSVIYKGASILFFGLALAFWTTTRLSSTSFLTSSRRTSVESPL